jgi:hypothetical protein
MTSTAETIEAQRAEIATRIGIPLVTYRDKWAAIRFSRFEPGWSQSVNAFGESVTACCLTLNRLEGSINGEAIAAYFEHHTPISGVEKEYVQALFDAMTFTKEFVEYWAVRLPRRKIDEFAQDTGVLKEVFGEEAKSLAALTSRPSRPDID